LKNKNLVILITLLSIFALGFLIFHTHADGDHTQDCFACRLIQQLVLVFIPIAALVSALICRTYTLVPVKKLSSFLLPKNLQGRAPPKF